MDFAAVKAPLVIGAGSGLVNTIWELGPINAKFLSGSVNTS